MLLPPTFRGAALPPFPYNRYCPSVMLLPRGIAGLGRYNPLRRKAAPASATTGEPRA